MKKITLPTLLFAVVMLVAPTQSHAQVEQISWDQFSDALVDAVKHNNEGVRLGALQNIVLYGEHLDVEDAVFDIVRIYRSDKNENARILALMALNKINNAWAIDFLKRSVQFEKSPRVRRHTLAVLVAHGAIQLPETGSEVAFVEID